MRKKASELCSSFDKPHSNLCDRNRGLDGGNARAENDSTCPTDIGLVWKYYNGSKWMDAGNGIVMRCESDIKLADLVKDPENIPYLLAGGVGLLALVVLLLTGSYCAYKGVGKRTLR